MTAFVVQASTVCISKQYDKPGRCHCRPLLRNATIMVGMIKRNLKQNVGMFKFLSGRGACFKKQ